jgi:hypothetical protein
MKIELTLPCGDVVAGEVESVEAFRQRLEAIESGSVPEPRVARAVRAFSALAREAPARHHQLEVLRDALGLA